MSSEWPVVTLREFVDLLAGFAFKSAGYCEDENSIRLLRGDNIGQRVIRWEDAKRWPSGDLANLARYALRVGDVVLAMDRPWIPAGLKVARVTESDTPSYLVQRVSRLRTKFSGDDNFLYALLSSPAFSTYIQNSTTGTAVPHISAKQILDYEFSLPPENTRAEIGQIVAFLDNRITLLRETNTTLEAIAQALFKSWFVDFDPVHAKQQGRAPEGMDAQTAALFPDSFEESELGMVPKGWQESTLGELIELTKGCSYKGNGLSESDGAYMFNLGCFNAHRVFASEKVKRYTGEYKPRHAVQAGDLIIANTDMTQHREILGRPAFVPSGFEPGFISHHVYKVSIRLEWKSKSQAIRSFLFFALQEKTFRERAIGFATGTTVLALPAAAVLGNPIVLPPNSLLEEFESLAQPLVKAIEMNEQKIGTLTELRDTLLPRLISGQLRLPEAQALAQEAMDT